jgi:dihydropteroate synthase
MILQLPKRSLDLSRPAVMGVLNVTPDSFSDGGRYPDVDAALRRAAAMAGEGAAIIDIGGESTRPGAQDVPEQEELDRVVPVIERLRRELDCVISIDTRKPPVMRSACAAGAEIVNDVFALRAPGAIEAVRESRAAIVLMHMQGDPRTMQAQPRYDDVVREVRAFLAERVDACEAAGIERDRLLIDPGFGFGKTFDHNLTLLGGLDALGALHVPLVVGVSRKSMLGKLLDLPVDRRLHSGLSAAALAVWLGASVIRTHDVRATVEAIRFAAAVVDARRQSVHAMSAPSSAAPVASQRGQEQMGKEKHE